MRLLYSLALILATPVLLAYFGVRGFRDARYWQRWAERLGRGAFEAGPYDYFIHAASLGEVNAAAPLIQRLLEQSPAPRIFVTAMTPTGSARIEALFGERVAHVYLPLDLPTIMSRLLSRVRPRLLMLVETELWPNLVHCAAERGIPVALVNGRLSRRSVDGYRRLRALFGPTLRCVDRILAQSRRDARRFEHCGARPDSVVVAGNLKFDVDVPASLLETGELLRAAWGVQRPVLVAGSTHEDDEMVISRAFSMALDHHPGALLIMAPRHPERFQRAAQIARDAGLSVALRSEKAYPGPDIQCFVVDTMGELLGFYAAADLAFVGGTLAEVGGHNLLEPASLGKPLLFGPHTDHVREVATRLLETGAARLVASENDVQAALDQLFSHPATRDRMGRAGLDLVRQGRGALQRTLDALAELPGDPRLR